MDTYYAKNKEQVLEYQRKRYIQNRDKISKYNEKYYKSHKQRLNFKDTIRRLSNNVILLHEKIEALTKTLPKNKTPEELTNDSKVIQVELEKMFQYGQIGQPKKKKPKPKSKYLTDDLSVHFD